MQPVLFAPFVPDAARPFDRRLAAHLVRRAGFGASPDEIQRVLDEGLEAAVERLFDDADGQEDQFQTVFDAASGSLLNFDDPSQVQAWWIYRMLTSQTPLREKLTLFWHGHFASSYYKVEEAALMHGQIETWRRLAWGDFAELVQAVARDPAMLVYLDGESNTKEHPNENFARELMELFTCGIGNYTERDVQEAARAFSGWHREGAAFVFNAEAHDFDRKEILGKAGRFDGGDVVEILMQSPATPRWIATKLLKFFASPEPSPAAIDEATALFDRTQLNVKWFLRDLFLSDYFYSDQCVRRRIASPAEFVIGSVRALGARMPASELVGYMSGMGQELLAPPNVKGWDGEQKWINSSTWPSRLAFAETLAYLPAESEFGSRFNLGEVILTDERDPATIVGSLKEHLFQGDLAADVAAEVVAGMIATDDGPQPDLFRDDEGFRDEQIRAAVALLLSLPEYHEC